MSYYYYNYVNQKDKRKRSQCGARQKHGCFFLCLDFVLSAVIGKKEIQIRPISRQAGLDSVYFECFYSGAIFRAIVDAGPGGGVGHRDCQNLKWRMVGNSHDLRLEQED